MNIEEQMIVADDVLGRLESFDPTCILAGGAPRDWHMGRLASDLDFYIYFRPDLQQRHLDELLSRLGFELTPKELTDPSIPQSYKRNPNLRRVLEQTFRGMKIQIMLMNKPTFKCVVNLFPLDICRAWYKDARIHTTREFDECMRTKTIHVLDELYSSESKYIAKIKKKFPGYSWEYMKNGRRK